MTIHILPPFAAFQQTTFPDRKGAPLSAEIFCRQGRSRAVPPCFVLCQSQCIKKALPAVILRTGASVQRGTTLLDSLWYPKREVQKSPVRSDPADRGVCSTRYHPVLYFMIPARNEDIRLYLLHSIRSSRESINILSVPAHTCRRLSVIYPACLFPVHHIYFMNIHAVYQTAPMLSRFFIQMLFLLPFLYTARHKRYFLLSLFCRPFCPCFCLTNIYSSHPVMSVQEAPNTL